MVIHAKDAPFDKREGLIWIDGKLLPWTEATVHPLAHGFHYGSAVFEGIRCYNNKIFKLEEHNQRLLDGMDILGMQKPYTLQELNDATHLVLEKNGIEEGYIRPLAWRGSEMMAIAAQQTTTHVMIAAWYWPSYFTPELKAKGITLKTSHLCKLHPKSVPTEAKCSGFYVGNTLSKHEAEAAGYHDTLMLDYEGHVAESSGANIFFVKGGELHTPTPTCFLDGITRRTVMGLARDMGMTIHERTITPDELVEMDEVFLTGTAAEVTPVGKIDDLTFTPGDVTHKLMDAYTALVQK